MVGSSRKRIRRRRSRMDETPVPIQKRDECELIPEGVSCTETETSYFIRVRRGRAKVTLKVPKDNFLESFMTINEFVTVDSKNWHGVWGTNG
jgi:hypothetical protein